MLCEFILKISSLISGLFHTDTDTEAKSSAHTRSQFMFGSRKRLRVPEFDGYSPDASKPLKFSIADEPVSMHTCKHERGVFLVH